MSGTSKPWLATYQNFYNGYHSFKLEGQHFENIGGFQSCNQFDRAKEDIETIICAVNCHEDLVASLKKLVRAIDAAQAGDCDKGYTRAVLEQARAALARSCGGTP